MLQTTSMIENLRIGALQLRRLGYEVTLLRENSKIARFKNLRTFTEQELRYWLRRERMNLAVLLGNGVMCVDIDGDDGMVFAKAHGIAESPMTVATRKGFHLYFRTEIEQARTRIRFLGKPLDLKFTGYVVAPPSVVEGHEYRFLNGPVRSEELPIFPASILELEPKREVARSVAIPTSRDFERALIYAKNPKVEGAISGQRGHARTFWFACRILTLFPSVSEEQLMEVLQVFNEKCQPPWDEASLIHKCREAFKSRGKQ